MAALSLKKPQETGASVPLKLNGTYLVLGAVLEKK